MRSVFTIHAGEYLVGAEIERRFRDLRVWIPSKDIGIDLLVTDEHQNKVASLQVKFSKDHHATVRQTGEAPGSESGGWWKFQRDKLAASPADYWVLTLYQFGIRDFDFIVIPPKELLARYDRLTPKAPVIQSYFSVIKAGAQKAKSGAADRDRCWETRGLDQDSMLEIRSGEHGNQARDFSEYLNEWPFQGGKRSTEAGR